MNAESPPIARLPEIKLIYDPVAQVVTVDFKPDEFRTWEFVQALLVMAQEQCKAKAALSRAAQMQQLMIQQQQDQALAQRIKHGR